MEKLNNLNNIKKRRKNQLKYINKPIVKEKIKNYNKKWYQDNKEKKRWYQIKQKYGITKEDWEKIYNDQNGKCYICGRTEQQIKKSKSKYLVIDHCHKTGKIRGLLCRFCNSCLTSFVKENVDISLRIYNYLMKEVDYGIVPEKVKKIDRKMPKVVEI